MEIQDQFSAAKNTVDTAISSLSDFLVDVFTDENSAERFVTDPLEELELAGQGDADIDRLTQAMEEAIDRLPETTADVVRQSVADLQAAAPPPVAPAQQVVVARAAAAPPPVREVVRQVTHHVTQAQPQVVRQSVTNQTLNQTNVDNSVNNNIQAEGDVDLDIDTNNVTATNGGVAAGDDIKDSAVNTGRLEGVQNAGDGKVDADGAVIGDGNTTLNDSKAGALSTGRGSATNVEADNANLGDGDINDVEAENANVGDGRLTDVKTEGDGQTVVGNDNEATGDVDVEAENVEGNLALAVGDENKQAAVQDNDTSVDQSTTDNSVDAAAVDNSVEGSANTKVDESLNTEQSLTSTVEDNDAFKDNDSFEDNSTTELSATQLDADLTLEDTDDTDVDFDAD